MTMNGVMAITLSYFTEFGKHALQKTICSGIYARVLYFLVHVQCYRKESSCMQSHLLMTVMSFLWIIARQRTDLMSNFLQHIVNLRTDFTKIGQAVSPPSQVEEKSRQICINRMHLDRRTENKGSLEVPANNETDASEITSKRERDIHFRLHYF